MDAIKTVNLTKKYDDVTAVKNLNLNVKKGEIFALLGINGAGKTTTVRMLSCLTRPTSGEAEILGFSVAAEQSKIKRKIGVSLQETAIAPNLTVRENLDLMYGIYGLNNENRKDKISAISDSLGLVGVMDKRAGKLSGGWQRRLSIAMALISSPEILFLDEPTLGLDVIARAELWDIIRSFRGRTTVILTTHYMEEAEMLSDRIGIMKDGALIAVGTAKELMESVCADRFENAFITIVKESEV